MRSLRSIAVIGAVIFIVSGCVVRERVVARPGPPGCRGGVWIEGHYGPRGRFHPGHWRCPGVIERVEID